jgi:prolyl oligopeptidase
MLRKNVAALALIAAFAAGGLTARAQSDPFQWLEGPADPAALSWARRESQTTVSALSARPVYASVAAELKDVLASNPPPPTYTVFGTRALRLMRDTAHPHGVLQVASRDASGVPSAWRTIVDVDALKTPDGKSYALHMPERDACLPPQYDRCLFFLAPGGSDLTEMREFDLRSGTFVAGGFRTAAGHGQAVLLDDDTVLIASETLGETKTASGWPATVHLWKRGTPLASSPIVATGQPADALLELSALGEGAQRKGVVLRIPDYSTFVLSTIDRKGTSTPVDLPHALKPFGALAYTGTQIVVQLSKPAVIDGRSVAAETVLAYDTSLATPPARRVTTVYTPAPDEYITDFFRGFAGTATGVSIVVDTHLTERIVNATFAAGTWLVRDGLHAAPGAGLTFAGSDPLGADVLVDEMGFFEPEQLSVLRPGAAPLAISTEKPAFDAAGMTVEVRTATSSDGTPIDYYLLRPKTPAHPGAVPTLMTGYGAFGISISPEYLGTWVGGPAAKLWFERGGAMAIPSIRGGGERGEAWHVSAMREHRQRSYDDFIAVANDLEHGFTTAKHLGVFGSSNGGLLAATVAIERPDLFGAVVSDVPLIDMLRFPLMGMGGAWMGEYGDPADPAARAVLLGYSPYQNIRAGRTYPPFFASASTEDDRVGPGHARKLAAKLQSVGATAYYYEAGEGGHGVSDALERPDVLALRMTFLITTLMGS